MLASPDLFIIQLVDWKRFRHNKKGFRHKRCEKMLNVRKKNGHCPLSLRMRIQIKKVRKNAKMLNTQQKHTNQKHKLEALEE